MSVCLSVTARQTRVVVGELGESLQENRGRSKWGGGEEAEDLAWPVGGLIPALALELLSSTVAQIFRFGLGCNVGSEILCSRLLPPLYSGPARSLGMALKKEIKFPPESKAP